MPTVTLRPRARIDIAEIWEYIAEDSEVQADAFIDRFDGQFRLMAQQPGLGRMRSELLPELRSLPFEKYVIFDRPTPGGIEIVRLLHSARDVDSEFRRAV